MANWIEDNAAKSIIGYTFVISAAVWGVSSFILDGNKVSAYMAVAEQYKTKVSVLEGEVSNLKSENERYRSWLLQDPKSFPTLESKIRNLEVALVEANKRPAVEIEDKPPAPQLYEFSRSFYKGESFVDPKTKAVIGVSDVTKEYTADAVLVLPGGEKKFLKGVRPGTTWEFSKGDKKYNLTLETVNWLTNELKASVSEVSD
ncbi:hypothetical protein [Pseudomonas sp. RIT-PI-r]|uniref:hypothetical protein n=1 Tax=Pseudomonas sp. RIT-PI-r TaxID=1699620 RepID=UPI0006D6B61F|nr:hypothetical protein [Pseudomonas sp. RIT-PI-r]KPG94590.1 hypothetical protein AK821_18420 [Pseudomonas sp. RIT-PI-r]